MAKELGGGGALGSNGSGAIAAHARQRDKVDEANEGSSSSWRLCFSSGLISGPSDGVWTTHGACGQHPVGHDGQVEMAIRPHLKRLTTPFLPLLNPKPWRNSKRSINKSWRSK